MTAHRAARPALEALEHARHAVMVLELAASTAFSGKFSRDCTDLANQPLRAALDALRGGRVDEAEEERSKRAAAVAFGTEIRNRDGDHCRYCEHAVDFTARRGAHSATYDVVDPDRPASIDNMVVACRLCATERNNQRRSGAALKPPKFRAVSPALGETHLDSLNLGVRGGEVLETLLDRELHARKDGEGDAATAGKVDMDPRIRVHVSLIVDGTLRLVLDLVPVAVEGPHQEILQRVDGVTSGLEPPAAVVQDDSHDSPSVGEQAEDATVGAEVPGSSPVEPGTPPPNTVWWAMLTALRSGLRCNQCGKALDARACGPTHALLSFDPTQHRVVVEAAGKLAASTAARRDGEV